MMHWSWKQLERLLAGATKPEPQPVKVNPSRREERVKCARCGAVVYRSEVLPGGYCPVCKG
jgi:formylmethanofuran dehydrogenase subunit E